MYDAISWIDSAWKKVSPETIRKCFAKAGHKGLDDLKVESCGKETSLFLSDLFQLMKNFGNNRRSKRSQKDF